MLNARTLMNSEFRQAYVSQGLLAPLLEALAFDTERFPFISWTGYFQAT